MTAQECDRLVRSLMARGVSIAEVARRCGVRRDTLIDRMRGEGRIGPKLAGKLRALR